MSLLSVNGVSRKERGEYVVRNVSFTQQSSQKIAIAGETGSGKTTLLKMIGGLVQPDEGEILFHGKRVLGPYEKLLPGHAKIAYLSQHFELRNNYRVEEELEAKNLLPIEEAERIYSICRIEHLLKRKTDQLSGGERQRIVLARLLTTSPELLLMDEPFSNLDPVHKSIIKSVIEDIGKQLGISCIMISHDAADTLAWADSIFVMRNGEVIQTGSPEELYHNPIDEYCAGLFGEYSVVDSAIFQILTGAPLVSDVTKILRPGHISITSENDNGLKGTVAAILFKGAYYLLVIDAGYTQITARVDKNEYYIGQPVYMKIKK